MGSTIINFYVYLNTLRQKINKYKDTTRKGKIHSPFKLSREITFYEQPPKRRYCSNVSLQTKDLKNELYCYYYYMLCNITVNISELLFQTGEWSPATYGHVASLVIMESHKEEIR